MGFFDRFSKPPTRDDFAAQMISALKQAGERRSLSYDASAFCIRLGDANQETMFLHNAFADFCKAPRGERKSLIERYLGMRRDMTKEESSFADARTVLLPKVRERFYHESAGMVMELEGAKNLDIPTQLLTEDLTLELVLDYPNSVAIVGSKQLAEWNASFDRAMQIARENLWKISNKDFQQLAPGLYVSSWQDTHDASRLFLHDLIWQLKVRGKHVAMVPERNVLLVTGSDDVDGLLKMAQLGEQTLQQATRKMTAAPVVLEESQWKSWVPPTDNPAHWPLRKCAMRSTNMFYIEQTELLNKCCKKRGEDVFVAQQKIMQQQDGTWFSTAVWVEGVTHALMPQADRIYFQRADKTPAKFASWENVTQHLSYRMEPTRLYPPRFRLRTFPAEVELAALELH